MGRILRYDRANYRKEGAVPLKYLRQIVILLAFSFVGEAMSLLIPLPIPGSIYGIVLLFLALETKLLKLSSVKDVSDFLISFMPVMFIPAAAGLIDAWPVLRDNALAYVVITIVTTVVVMGVSGLVTQWIIRRRRKGGAEDE